MCRYYSAEGYEACQAAQYGRYGGYTLLKEDGILLVRDSVSLPFTTLPPHTLSAARASTVAKRHGTARPRRRGNKVAIGRRVRGAIVANELRSERW